MVRAILNDAFTSSTFRRDEMFGFEVPLQVPGVDAHLLNPRDLWDDKDAYDHAYRALADKFRTAFSQFRDLVKPEVAAAGP